MACCRANSSVTGGSDCLIQCWGMWIIQQETSTIISDGCAQRHMQGDVAGRGDVGMGFAVECTVSWESLMPEDFAPTKAVTG